MRIVLIAIIGLLFQITSLAQSVEAADSTALSIRPHSPTRATLFSAALPGLGQVYNKKYWKVPIIYAGLGTCVYFIQRNNSKFQLYKDALVAEQDSDPTTINDTGFSSFQLNDLQNTYRGWRDLSWIILTGVYILNIIDANVDAHLFYFDVGKDLSLQVHPYLSHTARINSGLSLILNF